MRLIVGLAAVTAVAGVAAGCSSLTPLQNDINGLKAQVGRLQGEVESVKSSADQAASQASAAKQAADAANSTAQRALDLANQDQKSIDATNERLRRMFRHHLAK